MCIARLATMFNPGFTDPVSLSVNLPGIPEKRAVRCHAHDGESGRRLSELILHRSGARQRELRAPVQSLLSTLVVEYHANQGASYLCSLKGSGSLTCS
jgi:hypothetical protein